MIALTKGVDPSDSLVLREPIKNLPHGAKMGSSSVRREKMSQFQPVIFRNGVTNIISIKKTSASMPVVLLTAVKLNAPRPSHASPQHHQPAIFASK